MLKKAITYTDFEGEEKTQDYYFNLNKAELIELELSHEGGLGEGLKRIVAAEDGAQIVAEMKKIILKAYGRRSSDGKQFIKNQMFRDEFEGSEAYSELFVSLVTDPDAALEFISGIMPQDLMKAAQLELGDDTVEQPESPYVRPQEPLGITKAQALEMDAAELAAGLNSGALTILPDEVLTTPEG